MALEGGELKVVDVPIVSNEECEAALTEDSLLDFYADFYAAAFGLQNKYNGYNFLNLTGEELEAALTPEYWDAYFDNPNSSFIARRWNVSSNMLCTSSAGSKDACQGDEGGPVVINGASDTTDILVGIVWSAYNSWSCAHGFPGVHLRVSMYYSDILSVLDAWDVPSSTLGVLSQNTIDICTATGSTVPTQNPTASPTVSPSKAPTTPTESSSERNDVETRIVLPMGIILAWLLL